MDFLELAKERFSVRSYSPKPVEPEKVAKILEAAKVAPTATNSQPQRVYVLQSPEALEKIRRVSKSTYEAPLVFLVCSDEDRAWKSRYVEGYDSGEMDASIVCCHMMLEATALGLGSLWVLLFDPAKARVEFDLPESVRPHCLLCVGYKSQEAVPNPKLHEVYRPIDEWACML